MSTRILILKDGVITPSRSPTDNTAIINSLGSSLVTSVNGSTGVITLTKSSVGLNLVDNTSDLNKPISTATQTALSLKADLVGGVIPASQLPSYVDDVLEFANLAGFPTTGETGKIYVAIDTNLTYRWTGSIYSNMSSSLALGTTSTTAYRGDFGNTAYNHSQITTGNPHQLTAATLGLGNVTNTSDTQKPISTAQQAALDLKANLISPSFTGNINIEGFTSLGDNVAVKIKRLTGGTTGSTQGTSVFQAHNLVGSKIIGIIATVEYSPGSWMSANHTFYPGFQFTAYVAGGNIDMCLHVTNSGNILSKPFAVVIFYIS